MMAIGFLWTGHDYERAGVWFRQALALAEQLADITLRARSLNRLSNWLVNTGRIQEPTDRAWLRRSRCLAGPLFSPETRPGR